MGASDQGAVGAGLQSAVVLLPTKRGREELLQPTAGLSLPQRKLLTLVDGRRSLQEIAVLEPALRAERLARDAARLLERGLVQVDQGELPAITRPTTVGPRTAPPTTRPASARRPPKTVPSAARAAAPRRRGAPIGAIAAAVLAAVGVGIAYTIWQSAPSVLAPVAQSNVNARPAGEARAPSLPAPAATNLSPPRSASDTAVDKAPPATTVPAAARAASTPAPVPPLPARTPPPTESLPPPVARKATVQPDPRPVAVPQAAPAGPAAAPVAPPPPRAAVDGAAATPLPSASAASEAAPVAVLPAAPVPASPTASGAADSVQAKAPPARSPPPTAAANAEVPAWAREFAPIAPDGDGARAPAGNSLAPIERVPPTFPPAAVRLGITQGSVRARAIIAANGSVERVEFPATAAGSRVFEPAARTALLSWTFPPGEKGRVYEVLFNFVTP